jgi:hypothetical protein
MIQLNATNKQTNKQTNKRIAALLGNVEVKEILRFDIYYYYTDSNINVRPGIAKSIKAGCGLEVRCSIAGSALLFLSPRPDRLCGSTQPPIQWVPVSLSNG